MQHGPSPVHAHTALQCDPQSGGMEGEEEVSGGSSRYEIQLCMSHTCPQEHITLLYTSVVVVVYSECSILQADREADSTSSHLRLAAPRGAGQPA